METTIEKVDCKYCVVMIFEDQKFRLAGDDTHEEALWRKWVFDRAMNKFVNEFRNPTAA